MPRCLCKSVGPEESGVDVSAALINSGRLFEQRVFQSERKTDDWSQAMN